MEDIEDTQRVPVYLAPPCTDTIGGTRGGHGSHAAQSSESTVLAPKTESFQQLKNIILFWRIFKIKWPRSEEKLEFGGRLGCGARSVASHQLPCDQRGSVWQRDSPFCALVPPYRSAAQPRLSVGKHHHWSVRGPVMLLVDLTRHRLGYFGEAAFESSPRDLSNAYLRF